MYLQRFATPKLFLALLLGLVLPLPGFGESQPPTRLKSELRETVVSAREGKPLLTLEPSLRVCADLPLDFAATTSDQPLNCAKRAGAVTGVGTVCLDNENNNPRQTCAERAQAAAVSQCQTQVCDGGVCARLSCKTRVPANGLSCKAAYDFESKRVEDPDCQNILTCKRRCFCDCTCA